MAKLHAYNATLVERIDVTDELAIFRVRPDAPPPAEGGEPWFAPGQYTLLGLNREEGIDAEGDDAPVSVQRPMSIASAPGDEVVEFYLRLVDEPTSPLPLTPMLWRREAGARLYMRPSAGGRFTIGDTIGDDDPRLRLLVAAGTGLAPLVSMVRHLAATDGELENVALLHGVRYPAELGYRDELERLRDAHGLRYLPTISRPRHAPEWTGQGGRVEHLLEPGRIERTEGLLGLDAGFVRPDNAVVFACGLRGTLAATVMALLERGFIPDHRRIRRALGVDDDAPTSIFHEQYDREPILDVKNPEVVADLRRRFAAAG